MQKLSQYRTMPEAPFSVQQCLCVSGDPVRAQALSVLITCTTHTHAKVEILATFPTSISGDSPSRQLPLNHINCILTHNMEKCCMPAPTAVIMSGKTYYFAHAVHMQGSAQAHQALMLSESIPLWLRSSNSPNLKRLTMNLLVTRSDCPSCIPPAPKRVLGHLQRVSLQVGTLQGHE